MTQLSEMSGAEHGPEAAEWPAKPLRRYVKITSGQSPSKFTFGAGGTPYFKVEQLGRTQKYLSRDTTPYLSTDVPSVPAGSVVFAKRGAAISLNRVRLLAEPGFMDTNLMALTPTSGLDSEYLLYALTHRGLWDIADVTSVPQINNKHIYPLVLALPPTEEQRGIAEVLADADSYIEALKRLILKQEDVRRGLTQELMTGRVRLPGFEEPWLEHRVGSLGSTYGGLTGKSKDDFGVGSGRYIPFMAVMSRVRVDDRALPSVRVAAGEKQHTVRPGDLLFNTSSETPDEVALCAVVDNVPDDTYLNSFCFGLRLHNPTQLDALFLAYLFRSQVGRRHLAALAQGATRYNLSRSKFREIVIDLPRDVDEQRVIAQALADADALVAALSAKLAKARDAKRGIMQELITGRTRLPVHAVEAAA